MQRLRSVTDLTLNRFACYSLLENDILVRRVAESQWR